MLYIQAALPAAGGRRGRSGEGSARQRALRGNRRSCRAREGEEVRRAPLPPAPPGWSPSGGSSGSNSRSPLPACPPAAQPARREEPPRKRVRSKGVPRRAGPGFSGRGAAPPKRPTPPRGRPAPGSPSTDRRSQQRAAERRKAGDVKALGRLFAPLHNKGEAGSERLRGETSSRTGRPADVSPPSAASTGSLSFSPSPPPSPELGVFKEPARIPVLLGFVVLPPTPRQTRSLSLVSLSLSLAPSLALSLSFSLCLDNSGYFFEQVNRQPVHVMGGLSGNKCVRPGQSARAGSSTEDKSPRRVLHERGRGFPRARQPGRLGSACGDGDGDGGGREREKRAGGEAGLGGGESAPRGPPRSAPLTSNRSHTPRGGSV